MPGINCSISPLLGEPLFIRIEGYFAIITERIVPFEVDKTGESTMTRKIQNVSRYSKICG